MSIKLWPNSDIADFRSHCCFGENREEQTQLYECLTPLMKSLGLSHKDFYREVEETTGVCLTAPKFSGLGKRVSDEENYCAVALYLYQSHPEFCSAHSGLVGEDIEAEVLGKPLWEIVRGLPIPKSPSALHFVKTVQAEFVPRSSVSPRKDRDVRRKWWKLKPLKKVPVDENYNSFNLDGLGQPALVGEPVEVYLDVTSVPEFTASGYGFGFRKVLIKTSIDSNSDCEISYSQSYAKEVPLEKGGVAEFVGGSTSGRMEISGTDDKVLEGCYRLYESPFFTVVPKTGEYEFSAVLWTNLYDGSLTRHDGKKMPSQNKQAIIRALLSKSISQNFRDNGEYVLCKQDFKIEPVYLSFDGQNEH